jgi:hypothetical protein
MQNFLQPHLARAIMEALEGGKDGDLQT